MKFNARRTILVGLAFMAISAFWQMYDSITPLILKYSFQRNEVEIGAIMAIDNVLALFLLPILGVWSDKINTPFGKRKPFIVVGTFLACVAMYFMPIADNNRDIKMFMIATASVLLAMSLYRSPAVALMPDVTPRLLRSRGNAVINLLGAAGAVFSLVMIKTVVGDGVTPDYTLLFVSVIAFMMFLTIILAVTVKEGKWSSEARELDKSLESEGISFETAENTGVLSKDKKMSLFFLLMSVAMWYMSYNAVTTAFSRYASEVWGSENGSYASYLMIATVVAILSYVPIGVISGKIGRKKTIMGGIGFMMVGFLILFTQNHASVIAMIMFGFVGIGWAAINVNSFPMVVEIAADGDVGKFTGLYYSFSMAAQIVTPILSGAFLQYVSYNTLFPYSILFLIFAVLTMMQVRHGDIIDISGKSLLEHFDVD